MGDATRLGLGILAAAAALGVAGDALLRETPWGVNAGLWALLVVAAAAVVARGARLSFRRESQAFLFAAVAFAALVAWRASPALATLNLLAALGALSLAVARAPRVAGAGATRCLVEPARLVGEVFSAPFLLAIEDVAWKEVPRGRGTGAAAAALRGIGIGAPIFLVFLLLFAAADAAFEQIVTDLVDVERPLVHLGVWLLWTWVATGLLRHVLMREPDAGRASGTEPQARDADNGRAWLGAIETTIVLGALNALFLAFVAVQIRYLFGGDARVQMVAGLTYAEYARRGFFELVAVAALVLPLLLGGDWLVRRGGRRHLALFRALAALLVLLSFVVVASALERMRLYVHAYGLTELRLYTTAFMLWLAVVFVLLLATVLRARPRWFAFGALLTAFATVTALNAINPDALIAETNLDRHEGAPAVDASYLAGLSADAYPTLVERLDELPSGARATVADAMLAHGLREHADWRTWNLGRMRGEDAIRRRLDSVRAASSVAGSGSP